jgi:hypothetical protein
MTGKTLDEREVEALERIANTLDLLLAQAIYSHRAAASSTPECAEGACEYEAYETWPGSQVCRKCRRLRMAP